MCNKAQTTKRGTTMYNENTKLFVAVLQPSVQRYTILDMHIPVQHKLGEAEDVFFIEGKSLHVSGEGTAIVIGLSNSFEDMKEACEICLTNFSIAVNLFPGKEYAEIVKEHEEELQYFVEVAKEELEDFVTIHNK